MHFFVSCSGSLYQETCNQNIRYKHHFLYNVDWQMNHRWLPNGLIFIHLCGSRTGANQPIHHTFFWHRTFALLRLFALSLDHDKIHKIGERCRSMCRRISCVQRRVMGTAYSAPSLIRPVLSLLEDSKQELFQFLEIKDKSEIIRTEHISCYSQYTRKRKEFC